MSGRQHSFGWALWIMAAVAASGCGGLGTGGTTVAVRLIDAVPHSGTADYAVDGTTFIQQVSFTGVSTYGFVNKGLDTWIGTGTGTTVVIVPGTQVNLSTGGVFTIAAEGIPGSTSTPPTFVAFAGDNALPPNGQFRVRVINLSPDAGPVDISLTGQVIASGVAYNSASSYSVVNAGTYNINAVQTGSTASISSKASVVLGSGRVFTLFLVGQVANGTLTVVAQGDV